MFNTRPLGSRLTEEARRKITDILAKYDLAGCVLLVNADESGYMYKLDAKWSAIQNDPLTPFGIRIKAKSAELGHEEAHRRVEAAAHTLCALSDFGAQTYKWANDMLKILQRNGIEISHDPFNGQELGTITDGTDSLKSL